MLLFTLPNSNAVRLVAELSLGAGFLVGVTWLGAQWARLPEEEQSWRGNRVLPYDAAGRNMIPLFNLYWMFAVNAALCAGIDVELSRKGRSAGAPRGLAVLCPVSLIVAFLTPGNARLAMLLVSAGMWAVYMARIEEALDEAGAPFPPTRARP